MIGRGFKECASCAAKPGAPRLCEGCIHNRDVMASMQAELDDSQRYRFLVCWCGNKELCLPNDGSTYTCRCGRRYACDVDAGQLVRRIDDIDREQRDLVRKLAEALKPRLP